jgi:hypothetical protein
MAFQRQRHGAQVVKSRRLMPGRLGRSSENGHGDGERI